MYALYAPGDERPRYVGVASYMCERLGMHVAPALLARRKGAALSPKDVWILDILDGGGEPEARALDRGTGPGVLGRERHWIAKLSAGGADLFNRLHHAPGQTLLDLEARS